MKKILYIIDDINYNSGAKNVTLFQMKEIKKEHDVFLLTLTSPKEPIDFLKSDHILGEEIWNQTEIYATAFKKVLSSGKFTVRQKVSRIIYTMNLRMGKGDEYFERVLEDNLKEQLETFDTIIVMSEASKLRGIVSRLRNPKKIQWIHTDYARWSEYSEWSRAVTKNDAQIYDDYDSIVVLSEYCKEGMVKKLPFLAEKITVIPNLIDGDRILQFAKEESSVEIDSNILNLVTVARIDREKRIDELLRIAKELCEQQVRFKWYVIGDGPQKEELERMQKKLQLEEHVIFLGHLDNPYPVMARCDSLVLLSKYEGTPVTIDEAMVLGIRVIAPKIGGIEEQVKEYAYAYIYEKSIDIQLLVKRMVRDKNLYDYRSANIRKKHSLLMLFK